MACGAGLARRDRCRFLARVRPAAPLPRRPARRQATGSAFARRWQGSLARPRCKPTSASRAEAHRRRHRERRTSTGWRDTVPGEWVDDRLRRFAHHAELELRTGTFPNDDRWCGVYSADEPEPAYRYAFGQWWGDPSLSTSVAWILLNPATGDTDGRPRPVRTYIRNRTQQWGFTGFVIVNLFAYRHRDRSRLRETSAVGPFNDQALEIVTSACPQTVAAWGNDGANWERARAVRRRLHGELFCLPKAGRTLTARGQPFYPRALAVTARPVLLPPGD